VSSSTASLGLEVGIKLRDGGLIELAVEFADDDSVDVWLGTLGWGLEGLVFPDEIKNVWSIVLAQSLISKAFEDSVGVADVVVRIQLVVSVGENFEFARRQEVGVDLLEKRDDVNVHASLSCGSWAWISCNRG